MGKKKNCLVVESKRFLWWKWTTKYYKHCWSYTPSVELTQRKCRKCGVVENYFGVKTDKHAEVEYEDWREI